MAKLTRKQSTDIARTLALLERVQAYIAAPRTVICWVDEKATTALHYTREYVPAIDKSPDDAKPLYRVAKDIGTELCLLPDAIRNLRHMLNE